MNFHGYGEYIDYHAKSIYSQLKYANSQPLDCASSQGRITDHSSSQMDVVWEELYMYMKLQKSRHCITT